MPLLDVQLVLYNQLWTLLEASPVFVSIFPEGSRIKATVAKSSDRERAKPLVAFPIIRIKATESTTNERPPVTFGQNDPAYTAAVCDHGVPVRANFVIEIVHEKTTLQDQTPAEAAAVGAILARGRTLGFTWVTGSTLRGVKRNEENSHDTFNVRRTISRVRLEVLARPRLSQLTNNSTP